MRENANIAIKGINWKEDKDIEKDKECSENYKEENKDRRRNTQLEDERNNSNH